MHVGNPHAQSPPGSLRALVVRHLPISEAAHQDNVSLPVISTAQFQLPGELCTCVFENAGAHPCITVETEVTCCMEEFCELINHPWEPFNAVIQLLCPL